MPRDNCMCKRIVGMCVCVLFASSGAGVLCMCVFMSVCVRN